MFKRILYLTLITFLGTSLLACGGGGGTPSPPAVPAKPALSFAQSKVFRFTWTDAPDATFYRLLENSDGASGFTQVGGDIAQGAEVYDLVVPLYARLNAQYILQSCNAGGCTDPSAIAVSGNLVAAIGYTKARTPGAADSFGFAISLSGDGNTLAVGALFEDSNATDVGGDQSDNSASASGAVYVFTRSGGLIGSNWTQTAYLKASNTDALDLFGSTLRLNADGNTLVVGAIGEQSNATGEFGGDPADNSASSSGAVYVFTRSGGTWSQQAYLKASNAEANDEFGTSLSLSADGNTLAVGAALEDSNVIGTSDGDQLDNSASGSGAVYIFTRSGGTWSQQAYLKASNTGTGDRFGAIVSLSGDGITLAVGAWGEASNDTGIDGNEANNGASFSGAVYLFTFSGGLWVQQAYLKANNAEANDLFGFVVSLNSDGNTLAVGAIGESSSANGIGGNLVSNGAINSGAVYVFTRSAGIWDQQAYIKASNTGTSDQFGFALNLSTDGNTLAVGASSEGSNAIGVEGDQLDNSETNSGAVYVFTRSSGLWDQQSYLKASNTQADDRFGFVLSLSADGMTLAVGADLEDSNGINGDQTDNSRVDSGAVYLY